MDKILNYFDQLDSELAKYPVLVNIDKQAGHPKAKSFAVLAVAFVYTLLIFFNVAGSLLTNLLGFLYPAYASFKAIESAAKEDDTQWLTYWTVFGFMNTLEYFSDILLYWLPFYFLIKAGAILYMILPQFKGAEVLYIRFFRPVLLQQSGKIDGAASKMKKAMADAVGGKSD
eukprot:Partr_v1_DN28605_c0_g2_i5_m50258 putative receptor accessory protein